MKEKKFCQCKKGEFIYIFDYNYPENGVKAYKVIDVQHVDEDTNYSGCGPSYIPEHWYIHFDSPYLDRSISVEKSINDYVTYSGSYADNENGKTVVKYIKLGLFTELTNLKEKILNFYKEEINYLNKNIKDIDKEIDKLMSYRGQYSLQIAEINDKLLIVEEISKLDI